MYFCICCNEEKEEKDMSLWQNKPYPNRYGYCNECYVNTPLDISINTIFDVIKNYEPEKQLSLF